MVTKFRILLAAVALAIAGTTTATATHEADPWICSVLALYAGTYGPFTVLPNGDVYFLGELIYKCPPYAQR